LKRPLPCALLIVLLVLLVPPAWSTPAAERPPAPATVGAWRVTDCLGRTLTFEKIPERILLAGRATVLIVDAVYMFPDARDRVVGVGVTNQGLGDFFPVLDKGSARKARFENSAGPEQLAGLHPDLVILKSFMKERLGDSLVSIGIPVLYVDLETPAAFASDIRMLGDLFQDPARAAFITAYYESRVRSVQKSTAGVSRPSALVVQYSERDGAAAISVPPASWIQTLLVEAAGGEPVWAASGTGTGAGSGWNKVSAEQAAAWKPAHTLVVSYQVPAVEAAAALARSGTWRGTLHPFPADFHSWDQADSRWILGLQWTAKTLHPELFAGLDLEAEVRSFYGQLYGLDGATIETVILPRVEGALAAR
jgi:iron complex transport system substrate-binding protein